MERTVFTLSEPLVEFVDDQVRSGAYDDRDAVVREALERLRETTRDDAEKLARLNARLQTAVDQMDRGEGIEITDLDAHFATLREEVLRRCAD